MYLASLDLPGIVQCVFFCKNGGREKKTSTQHMCRYGRGICHLIFSSYKSFDENSELLKDYKDYNIKDQSNCLLSLLIFINIIIINIIL